MRMDGIITGIWGPHATCSGCGKSFRTNHFVVDERGKRVAHCSDCYARFSSQSHGSGAHDRLSKVLLLDDDLNVRLMVRVSLDLDRTIGEVLEAGTAREGVQLAWSERPDLVICDSMNLGNGDEAGEKIREILPNALIVSFSGTEAERPWADAAVVKGTRDALTSLHQGVFGGAS